MNNRRGEKVMTIAGLILMGGKNSRMGGEKKAFLTYEGKPFYQWAAEAMSGLDSIYLSVEEREAYPKLDYPMLEDTIKGIGPMGGILSSFKQCREDALLVLPCDMPKLSAGLVDRLLKAWRSDGRPAFAYAGERVQPLLGIYTRDCIPKLEEMVENGTYKMALLASLLPHHRITLGEDAPELFHINTKQEYADMKRSKEPEADGRRDAPDLPVMVAVSGIKNSGKTTLIEGILPVLLKHGMKVAVIKHDGHEFEPDVPGTDSYRHRKAGAMGTAVFSGNRFLVAKEVPATELELAGFFPEADLILLEGMKGSDYPKLEVVRASVSSCGVCGRDSVLAYVTDVKRKDWGRPAFDPNDYEGVARFLLDYWRERTSMRSKKQED